MPCPRRPVLRTQDFYVALPYEILTFVSVTLNTPRSSVSQLAVRSPSLLRGFIKAESVML